MKKIGVGVVGLGWAAQRIHLPRIQETPEMMLIGVTDVSVEGTKEIACLYNVKGFTNYIDLCECKDIDAVFILTPPSSHFEIAEIACENQKHIFCEKPIALNLDETEQMVKKARKANVTLMTGYMMRFSPNIRVLKEMLPLLGGNLKANTAYVLSLPPDKATFQYDRRLGGGALFDMGTHHVDLLRWFFGEAKPIDVDMKVEGDVDVLTRFQLRFNSGVTTLSEISWTSPVFENSIYIEGEKGYVQTNFSATKAIDTRVYFNLQNVFREAGELSLSIRDSKDPYQKEIDHFVTSVLTGQEPLTSGEEALNDLKLVSDIYSLWESKCLKK